MASDYLISGEHNIPIGVIPIRKFMACLPVGFRRGSDGKMHHDPDRVNLFLCSKEGKLFANAHRKVVKVNGDEDFAVMKRRLLTLPIFLNVSLKERYVEHYIVAKRTIITWMHVMVCITPKNPVIKAQLEQQFAECEKLLGEGKNFSLEIKVGQILKDWYAQSRDRTFASYYSYGSTICVTNFSQRCSMCYHPLVWFVPITWVLGPPYLIYRAVKCNDVITELSAIVTLMKEGPRVIVQNTSVAPPNPPHYVQSYTGQPPPQPNPIPQIQMAPYNSVENSQVAPAQATEAFQNTQKHEDDEPLIVA